MTGKTAFFEGLSWFKFNNFGLAQGMNLKFYASVTKGLNIKVRQFRGLVPTFLEVTGVKLVGDKNRVKLHLKEDNSSSSNKLPSNF